MEETEYRDARPLWDYSISEAARAIDERRMAPVDLVNACIRRKEEVDPFIHSYIHLAVESARRAALNAGGNVHGRRSPLHGVPFAVKATYDVAGMPSNAASRLRLGRVPEKDARLVSQLREQGAICMGLLSSWEYGTGNGGEYFDLPFPPARNPWNTELFTGGSSSGCGASVIAGTSIFALGSDTTGSVRLPAAATGAVGMIPTPGRFSLDGMLPNCYSLDVPGTFSKTAEDAAILFTALARPGPGENWPTADALASASVRGMKIAVVRDPGAGFPSPDEELGAGLDCALRVLESLGARLVDVRLPVPAAECFAMTRLIGPVESASIHEAELREHPELMGFALRDKLMAGSLVRAVDYLGALRRRALIARGMDALLLDFDALVTFGTLHLPPRLGVEPEMTAFTVETMLTPFNLSGNPALVQCTGFSSRGLPLHWQIVGRKKEEFAILRLAMAYERSTAWRAVRPSPTAHSAPSVPRAGSATPEQPCDEATAFAGRHGLRRLDRSHLARMQELIPVVARFGAGFEQVLDKNQAPMPGFGGR